MPELTISPQSVTMNSASGANIRFLALSIQWAMQERRRSFSCSTVLCEREIYETNMHYILWILLFMWDNVVDRQIKSYLHWSIGELDRKLFLHEDRVNPTSSDDEDGIFQNQRNFPTVNLTSFDIHDGIFRNQRNFPTIFWSHAKEFSDNFFFRQLSDN